MDIGVVVSAVRAGPLGTRRPKEGDEFFFQGIGNMQRPRIGTDIEGALGNGRHKLP